MWVTSQLTEYYANIQIMQQNTNNIEFLKHIGFFHGVDSGLIKDIANQSTVRTYPKNEQVFMEGDEAEGIMFVISGAIKTTACSINGDESTIDLYAENRCFSANISRYAKHNSDAKALIDTDVLILNLTAMQLIYSSPVATARLCQVIQSEKDKLQSIIMQSKSLMIYQRILYFILKLANDFSEELNDVQRELQLGLTQNEIAAYVGSARESVSQNLRVAKDSGVLLHTKIQKGNIINMYHLERQLSGGC